MIKIYDFRGFIFKDYLLSQLELRTYMHGFNEWMKPSVKIQQFVWVQYTRTYMHTISQSSHVSEENGHIEVDTEAKEQ